MNESTDQQLLREYAERQSETAFAELVRRHLDFVYSAALRMVSDPHTAEDVAQNTFIALTKNALQVRNRSVLSSWLHSTARNLAANAIRTEVRRREREQEAAAMNELLANEPEAVWKNIAPHLDDAIAELGDSDRDALLLRYFEHKSAREMGQIFGTSEEAAQKRVTRAVERLRELFSKRGVTIGASGLVVLISSNAVHAAPIALTTTLSTLAVLTGTTAAHSSTAITATKAIAMTLFQKAVVTTTVVVVAGAGIYEAHQATKLRAEVQTLQQQQAPLVAQVQQLQHERDDATNQLASLTEEVVRAGANNVELLRLRREVGALRQQRSDTPQPATIVQSAPENTPPPDESSQIAQAVAQGDPAALQRLSDYSTARLDFFNTHRVGVTNEQLSALSDQAFGGLWAAFHFLADEAIKGNSNARSAIDQAVRTKGLQGSATDALGKLAAHGDQAALQTLLNYDEHGILLSSAVSALCDPANNGNEQAIALLASVMKDPKNKPLWHMASLGLQNAAASGNQTAIDALKFMPPQQP